MIRQELLHLGETFGLFLLGSIDGFAALSALGIRGLLEIPSIDQFLNNPLIVEFLLQFSICFHDVVVTNHYLHVLVLVGLIAHIFSHLSWNTIVSGSFIERAPIFRLNT